MSQNAIIFRSDEKWGPEGYALSWEPGCPLMVKAVQISSDPETHEEYLESKVMSITCRKIASVKLTAKLQYQGHLFGEGVLDEKHVDIAPGDIKPLHTVTLQHTGVIAASLHIDSVGFFDGSTWTSSRDVLQAPEPRSLYLSEEAMAARERLMRQNGITMPDDAYLFEDHGIWWMCGCGQVNLSDHNTCVSCYTDKSILPYLEDEASLLGRPSNHR